MIYYPSTYYLSTYYPSTMLRAMATIALCIISMTLFAQGDGPFEAKFERLSTRSGVTVPIWVIFPKQVQACVVLFSGGGGRLNISAEGISKTGNFLIRSRDKFVAHNMLVLIPDVGSDQGDLWDIRIGADHLDDIKKMILWLRDRCPNKPVWLIATSRGTISAAAVAAKTSANEGPDGIVLSATVTQTSNSGSDSVYSTDIDEITVPTLLVHHQDDDCYVTPYSALAELYDGLKKVKQKRIKSFTGGKNIGHECRVKSYDGFNGIEQEVVDFVSEWIKSH